MSGRTEVFFHFKGSEVSVTLNIVTDEKSRIISHSALSYRGLNYHVYHKVNEHLENGYQEPVEMKSYPLSIKIPGLQVSNQCSTSDHTSKF